MRHGKKVNHLGRTSEHRKALLSNLASSLIEHKRINTTLAKAKALRTFIEPLVTKSKNDTTHNRRTVFANLKDKDAVSELFRTISPKIAERPGGYTRIIKTGFRLGDNAEMCMIEFVDFNEVYGNEKVRQNGYGIFRARIRRRDPDPRRRFEVHAPGADRGFVAPPNSIGTEAACPMFRPTLPPAPPPPRAPAPFPDRHGPGHERAVRLVDAVDIDIKIIVDDVAAGRNQNRRKDQ